MVLSCLMFFKPMNVRNTLQTVLKILLVSFISIGKLEIIWGGCFRRWSWWWVVEFLRGGPRAGVCGVVSRRRRRRGRRGTRPVLGARLGPPPALYRPFSADPTLVEGGCWRSSTESSDVSQWAEVRMPLFVTERERGVKFRDFFVWILLKMIWAAGHLFLATVLTGQSEVVLLSANYGAILYNGINKHPKMVAYEED